MLYTRLRIWAGLRFVGQICRRLLTFGGPWGTRGEFLTRALHPLSFGSPNPRPTGGNLDPSPPPSGLKPAGLGSRPTRLPSLRPGQILTAELKLDVDFRSNNRWVVYCTIAHLAQGILIIWRLLPLLPPSVVCPRLWLEVSRPCLAKHLAARGPPPLEKKERSSLCSVLWLYRHRLFAGLS